MTDKISKIARLRLPASRRTLALTDSAAMHAAHPESWDYPERALALVRPGDCVKVCAHLPVPVGRVSAERFWVELTLVDGERLEGTVNNELIYTSSHGARFGDRMAFERKHVLDVTLFDSAGRAIDFGGREAADLQMAERGFPPGRAGGVAARPAAAI